MVDGFATLGPRHARALAARRRRETWLAGIIENVRRDQSTRSPLTSIAHHSEDGHLLDSRTAAVEVLNIIRPATAVAWFVAFAAHALDRWPGHRAALNDDDFTWAFVQEVRRYYPFVPFLGGRAARDLRFQRVDIPRGTLVLLDVYGQHHDPRVWPAPYAFRPERFLEKTAGTYTWIPFGGGVRRFHQATTADGAGRSGLSSLTYAAMMDYAANAAIAVALANTLFFAAATAESRANVALYLLITVAPFAVVAPVIGPLLDRLQHGRRVAMALSFAGRAFLLIVMAAHVHDWLLYPAALGFMVLAKSYGVLQAAVIPRVLPPGITLVKTNSRLTAFGLVAAGVSGAVAAGISALTGSPGALLFTAAICVVGVFLCLPISSFGLPWLQVLSSRTLTAPVVHQRHERHL